MRPSETVDTQNKSWIEQRNWFDVGHSDFDSGVQTDIKPQFLLSTCLRSASRVKRSVASSSDRDGVQGLGANKF